MSHVLHWKDDNFDTELQDAPVCLVDFSAEWCGPCKALAPVIEEIASEYAGKIKVAKVDVDESRDLAAKYGIMGVPTLIVFKDGSVSDQLVGNQPKQEIVKKIEAAL